MYNSRMNIEQNSGGWTGTHGLLNITSGGPIVGGERIFTDVVGEANDACMQPYILGSNRVPGRVRSPFTSLEEANNERMS